MDADVASTAWLPHLRTLSSRYRNRRRRFARYHGLPRRAPRQRLRPRSSSKTPKLLLRQLSVPPISWTWSGSTIRRRTSLRYRIVVVSASSYMSPLTGGRTPHTGVEDGETRVATHLQSAAKRTFRRRNRRASSRRRTRKRRLSRVTRTKGRMIGKGYASGRYLGSQRHHPLARQ